jgi:hypothetical protein
MRAALRTALAVLVVGVLTLLALELGVRGAVATGLLHTPVPAGFDDPYWLGDRPDFGVWRHPNAEFVHHAPCFEATYRTNSIGARDVERPRDAPGPRVVVLGDSFTEGWGVAQEERYSSRLELATGIPHLNFAMAHFSPYQSVLVYRDLAKQFSHDAVLIGILPVNDFVDLDYDFASGKQAGYLYRYRPYLVPDGDGWKRFDWREPSLLRLLRRGSYAFNALSVALQPSTPAADAESAPAEGARRIFSFFYDASEQQMRLMEHTLELLADEARGKQVAVALIPGLRDLRRHAFSGPDPLTPRLEAFGHAHGIRVLSLLAPMAARTQHWSDYYFPCDYHFNASGHAAAAEILRASLGGWLAPGAEAPR